MLYAFFSTVPGAPGMEQYTSGVNLSQIPGVPSNAGSTDQSQSPLHHANITAATSQPGVGAYPTVGQYPGQTGTLHNNMH